MEKTHQSHRILDFNVSNCTSLIINSRYAQILLILTILGFLLRFYDLGLNSLWLDEATTHAFAKMSIFDIWQATAGGEFNPPLFYWLEHYMLLIGDTETHLRVVSAIFGFLTIPLIYCAGKEFFDRNVGIIAAAGFTFSPNLIYYSQEARAYSMALFFVTLATIFYFKALKTNDLKNWRFFGVFAALAFWSHFYVLVIIATFLAYAIITQITNIQKNLQNLKMIASSIVLFLVLCSPLIPLFIQLLAKRTAEAPSWGIQGPALIVGTLLEISGYFFIPMLLFLALFITSIIQVLLINKNKGFFLVGATTLPLIFSVFLSYKMPMVPRYLIWFNIIFLQVWQLCIKYFILSQNQIKLFIISLYFISVISLFNYIAVHNSFESGWRGVSDKIEQMTNPGDRVVVLPGYNSQPLNYYYSNASDQTLEFNADTAKYLDIINTDKGDKSIYFVLTTDIFAADPNTGVVKWLNKNTQFLGQNRGILLYVSSQ